MRVCEICGKKTSRPYSVFIEGANLVVCENCAKKYKNATPLFKQTSNRKQLAKHPTKKVREKTYEIVDDYAEIIRKAREKKGLKQEEVAKAIAEQESEIRKIERGDLVPEVRVARKLEKFFGITLVREITEEDLEREEEEAKKLAAEKRRKLTLGDIVVVKKR